MLLHGPAGTPMDHGGKALHNITDVEAFCTHIANGRLKQHNPQDQEELIAYLITETWLLSRRYNPSKGTFSAWAANTLHRRIIDWLRNKHGDTRHTPRPPTTTLDHADTPSPLGNPADSHTPLEWVLPPRDSRHDRPYPTRTRTPTRTT